MFVQYPHLVHAAVASSAPVEAVVDFTGYNDVVAKSLGQHAIGGSDRVSILHVENCALCGRYQLY